MKDSFPGGHFPAGDRRLMRVATAKMAIIRVQQQDFEVAKELAMVRAANPKVGAIASFVGLVRDLSDDTVVNNLVLEHYPGMTERSLEGIVREATGRWDVIDVTVIHRVGLLKPLDQIVLVMVGEQPSRRRVQSVWIHHALPEDGSAILEEGSIRRRIPMG